MGAMCGSVVIGRLGTLSATRGHTNLDCSGCRDLELYCSATTGATAASRTGGSSWPCSGTPTAGVDQQCYADSLYVEFFDEGAQAWRDTRLV